MFNDPVLCIVYFPTLFSRNMKYIQSRIAFTINGGQERFIIKISVYLLSDAY